MKKANLSWLFLLNIFLLIVLFISLSKPSSVKSAIAQHIVISEIQIAGATSNDEFVELYNPTNSDLDLTGWRLARKTSGTTSANLVTNMSGVIPAHGYFLITPSTGYTGSASADLNYSPAGTRISADNTIYLFASDSATLVDKVAIGSGGTDGEGTPAPLPGNNESIERKAQSTSTQTSMTTGGDVNQGNGEDTDNNASDFILRLTSNPQNSSASAESPSSSPSPSASTSASASPSASPSASSSPSPSASPSASPSPSPSPSAIASASPSPSPSASPSLAPSPSASPSASITPSPSPSASATPISRTRFSCKFEPKTIKFSKWEFTLLTLSCSRVNS